MTKLASIVLAVLVFSQGILLDVDDVVHMDELFEHARLHSEKYGDNFLVFLSKHYGSQQQEHKKEHQEEQQDHEELPFNHHSCNHISTVFVPTVRPAPLLKSCPISNSRATFHYEEHYSSFEKFDIFQPPRAA